MPDSLTTSMPIDKPTLFYFTLVGSSRKGPITGAQHQWDVVCEQLVHCPGLLLFSRIAGSQTRELTIIESNMLTISLDLYH